MSRVQLIHGAGGGAWEWNPWSEVLRAHGHQVDAIDLMPAPDGIEATTLADYAAQVRAAAAGARPILVGASLGGLLALMAADEVAPGALVLVNPMPPAPLNLALPDRAPHPARMPWRSQASLAGTRRAMPDADDAACLYAFQRWRDESGAVLDAARAGVEVPKPACPVLVMASTRDEDVPEEISIELARWLDADLVRVHGASHVGPLLGRRAARCAEFAVAWLALHA